MRRAAPSLEKRRTQSSMEVVANRRRLTEELIRSEAKKGLSASKEMKIAEVFVDEYLTQESTTPPAKPSKRIPIALLSASLLVIGTIVSTL